ncbi:MAG TPA: ThuA domain-containing protein [Chloroflexota bacterium]|nr:ThuA domain-containing protein [Chloroflexota bacterium]
MSSTESPRTKVKALLFAQDDKYHPGIEDALAAERATPWLEEMGIAVTRTKDRARWTREGLAQYQLFMPWLMPQWDVAKNAHEHIAPEEAEVVASFVRNGGGLFAFHGATVVPKPAEYEAYVDVLGTRFKSHPKYQEFDVRITRPDHPITRGLKDFRTSDELYIHLPLAPDAEVLATAEWEGETHPMAYTRRAGRGAVYYLALGHDQATWDHPAFKQLVVNGARWLFEQTRSRAA